MIVLKDSERIEIYSDSEQLLGDCWKLPLTAGGGWVWDDKVNGRGTRVFTQERALEALIDSINGKE